MPLMFFHLLERSLSTTVENGKYVTEGDRFKIFCRDWYLWCLQLVPTWKHWLEMGARREGMTRYKYADGLAFSGDLDSGFCFPQVYCVPLSFSQNGGGVRFTDDVIFASEKKGLFQLVALLRNVEELGSAGNALRDLDTVSTGEIRADEATYICHDQVASKPVVVTAEKASGNMYRVATDAEFIQDPTISRDRPAPMFYNEQRLLEETKDKRYVILRPDRFVFAVCANKAELDRAAASIPRILGGNSV
ncbi:hypothetical protein LTR66_004267 [Elasticomyces elasticus]|nr:hypothetical protein LTR66_004267 [Elasticomyces elasticus]